MSSPARSCSLMTTAIASWNFSRKRTSSMQVSSGRPHMQTSNQRGRGYEPVIVLGRIRLAVAVNMAKTSGAGFYIGRVVHDREKGEGSFTSFRMTRERGDAASKNGNRAKTLQ